jgi:hypothetical protein
MLHLGHIVEEIATKRRGKIDNTSGLLVDGQEQTTQWRVFFSDGKQPLLQYFSDEAGLRLIRCPHSNTTPAFVPERGIMG